MVFPVVLTLSGVCALGLMLFWTTAGDFHIKHPEKTGALRLSIVGGAEHVFGALLFTVLVIAAVIVGLFILQGLLVRGLVAAVKKFDTKYLGVEIEVDNVSFNLCTLRVEIKKFIVHNPKGYTTPHVFKANDLTVDLDAGTTIKSLWKFIRRQGPLVIQVDEIKLQGIEAIIEYDGYISGTSNVQAILNFMGTTPPSIKEKKAEEAKKVCHEIEAVYSWWHAENNEHTFHFAPAWEGETLQNVAFYAHTKQVEGTKPVYDFWRSWYTEHTFHFEPEWSGERKNHIAFYAFENQVQGTEPVYDYWHSMNSEHLFHMGDPWPLETKNNIQFYAYAKDPHGKAYVPDEAKERAKIRLVPIFDFWHSGNGEHTIHAKPAWPGERINNTMFYAYNNEAKGTEPVWVFWSKTRGEHVLHFLPARENEEKHGIVFHAFREQKKGTQPVYAFYHTGNKEHTYHMGGPWGGEERKEIEFYAYKEDPSALGPIKVDVFQVALDDISAQASTRLSGITAKLANINYDHFSDQFGAHGVQDIIYYVFVTLFKSLVANVGLC